MASRIEGGRSGAKTPIEQGRTGFSRDFRCDPLHPEQISVERESLDVGAILLLAAFEAGDDDSLDQAGQLYAGDAELEGLVFWAEACADVAERWASGRKASRFPTRNEFMAQS